MKLVENRSSHVMKKNGEIKKLVKKQKLPLK
jgi:hypothetical protein